MINTQVQLTIPVQVSKTDLKLQDNLVDLDDWTELADDSIFKFDIMQSRSYERDKFVMTDLTIEMNPD